MNINKEYTEFLDSLRESGITNMFGACPYLMEAFPELGKRDAADILCQWMRNFGKDEQ